MRPELVSVGGWRGASRLFLSLAFGSQMLIVIPFVRLSLQNNPSLARRSLNLSTVPRTGGGTLLRIWSRQHRFSYDCHFHSSLRPVLPSFSACFLLLLFVYSSYRVRRITYTHPINHTFTSNLLRVHSSPCNRGLQNRVHGRSSSPPFLLSLLRLSFFHFTYLQTFLGHRRPFSLRSLPSSNFRMDVGHRLFPSTFT